MDIENATTLTITLLIAIFITVVFVFALSKTKWFKAYNNGKLNVTNTIVMILFFTLLSVITSHYLSDYCDGFVINIRDLPVVVAGLLGGPITGISTGVLAGVERFSEGGVTDLPCMLGTICSGIIGGIIWYIAGKRYPKLILAAIAMLITECLHMVFVYFLSDPSVDAADIVQTIAPWMIAFSVIGIIIVSFIYDRYLRSSAE